MARFLLLYWLLVTESTKMTDSGQWGITLAGIEETGLRIGSDQIPEFAIEMLTMDFVKDGESLASFSE